MKFTVLVLVLFVAFTITPEIFGFVRIPVVPRLSNASNQCEENRHNGNFTCVKNPDNSYNATFDCQLNNHTKLELILRYPNFPKRTKHLTIQNCDSLVLDLHCEILSKSPHEEDTSMIHISHLHILNINHMVTRKEIGNHSNYHFFPVRTLKTSLRILDLSDIESYEDLFSDMDDEFEEREFYYLNDLVADTMIGVTFENIKHAYIENAHIPSGLFRCDKSENDSLEYFKMINVKALHFKGFSEDFSGLKEFEMNNVTIMPKNSDEPLKVNNSEAVVKITNSRLIKMEKIFKGRASKVIITGNKAPEISSSAFVLENANEFIFSGNTIDRMSPRSFDGTSQITQITNNIIHSVDERAFSSLMPKSLDSTSLNHTKRIYNFSNNELHILHYEAVTFPYLTLESYYDTIIVNNNSINCSCRNFMWFSSLAEMRYNVPLTYSFWMKKANENKCLNIPDCSIAHVLYNFYELCEGNYQCPKNVSLTNPSTNFIREVEETLVNTLHVNREISDTNTKILQVLKSDIDNHNHDNGSLLTVNTLCLIILLLLCSVIFGYLVLVRLGRLREFKPRRLGSIGGTEMDSQASLNP